MTFKEDFNDDTGWSAVDTNFRLNHTRAKGFVEFLKDSEVTTIIRYYANSRSNSKTITPDEAKFLSAQGFSILTIFQQNNRKNEDFGASNGRRNARTALEFAQRIGQPEGSTLLFAVDADFTSKSKNKNIADVLPYFESVKDTLGDKFRIGAYGSGFVLQTLLDEDLIEVPWLSMSRLFTGTRTFFENDAWAVRQIPLPLVHPFGADAKPDSVRVARRGDKGVFFDKNTLNLPVEEIGSFRVDQAGNGVVIAASDDESADATLGGGLGGVIAAAEVTISAQAESTNAFVKTEALNLREEPNGTVIRALTIGEPVNDFGPVPTNPRWNSVEVGGESGVVFGKFLRPPSTPDVEALLEAVVAEWVRFDKGRALEHHDPHFRFVGEMWQSIGLNLDGRNRDVPWSAAFVSFVVRNGGEAYQSFKFNAQHSVFVNDAIHARNTEDVEKPFWGFRISEKRPEIGDIIQRNRGGNSFSFDHAENHVHYASHSDIVVEVTSHVVRVIGGNVGHTVSMRDNIQEYDLNDDGFLDKNQPDGQRIISLLKNRAHEVA